jgi:hypothetical protein
MRVAKPLCAVLGGLSASILLFWCASQWWEKAFATRTDIDVSPNGCYRLEELKPYWVFPGGFHPRFEDEERWNPLTDWYAPWFPNEYPGFYRLYDNRTGALLAESGVRDLTTNAGAGTHWPDERLRWMSAGFTQLADNLPPCPVRLEDRTRE